MNYSSYNGTPNYSYFRPLPMTEEERQRKKYIHNYKRNVVDEFAKKHNLQKLKSDNFGMDVFYYNHDEKQLYRLRRDTASVTKNDMYRFEEIEWKNSVSFSDIFEPKDDPHILEINGLL